MHICSPNLRSPPFSLPENCSPERAALAEPLSVVLHAIRRASLQPGQSVLVLGAGSIGILACSLARTLGASRVAAADINRARLDWALAHGVADDIFQVPTAPRSSDSVSIKSRSSPADEGIRRSKENATEALRSFGLLDGFDIVIECTGVESSAQMGIFVRVIADLLLLQLLTWLVFQCVRTGGKLMLVGMGTATMCLPISAAATREVDILGTFRYANTYPSALAMLASGHLRGVDHLITHRIPLDRAGDAFKLLRNGIDDNGNLVLKVVVEPPSSVSF